MKKMKQVSKRGRKLTRLQKIVFVSAIFFLPLLLVLITQRQDIRQRAAAIDPTSGPVQPMGQSGNWNLVFSDEFTTPTLDSSKWIPCYPSWDGKGCGHGNGELQWYQPQNVTFSNGIMNLVGKKETKQGSDGKSYNYTAGMVASAGKFSDTYYYAEMRAKSPKGKGYWPAFWTLPADGSWPPEIDVLEILGHEPNVAHTTYHWTDGGHQQQGRGNTGVDYSADYHVFAADWTANAIVWYIDGKEVYRYTNASKITNKPMYILVNLAIGGTWPGNPDNSTVFPQSFEVDYVRVWKKGTGTPQPTVAPSAPVSVVPTFTCLGACPTIQPTIGTVVPTQPATQPTVAPTTPQAQPTETIDPCEQNASVVSHAQRGKNNSSTGSSLIDMIMNFLKKLLALLEQLLGGGQPIQPQQPTQPPVPDPTGTPCP